MSNLRELTMDEVEMVSGGKTTLTGYYQDADGIWAVYRDCGSAVDRDVLVSNEGGTGGWLDYPANSRGNDNSGYFVTLGASAFRTVGGSVSFDFSNNDFYLGVSSGFGTPLTAQAGYSTNVPGYLSGASVNIVSGNPGIPVVSVDTSGRINLDTTIIGTPSVEIGVGTRLGNPENSFDRLLHQIGDLGTTFSDGIFNWIRYGDNGLTPSPLETQR